MNISDINKRKKWLEKCITQNLNNFANETKTIIHTVDVDRVNVTPVGSEKVKYIYKANVNILL